MLAAFYCVFFLRPSLDPMTPTVSVCFLGLASLHANRGTLLRTPLSPRLVSSRHVPERLRAIRTCLRDPMKESKYLLRSQPRDTRPPHRLLVFSLLVSKRFHRVACVRDGTDFYCVTVLVHILPGGNKKISPRQRRTVRKL